MGNKVTIYTRDNDVITKDDCDDDVTRELENLPFNTDHVTCVNVQTGGDN